MNPESLLHKFFAVIIKPTLKLLASLRYWKNLNSF